MASKQLAKGLKQSALTVALGLCFVGGVQAQTNTAGAVTGQAASGDTITISNPATGFSRTITVGADGSYRFSQLPTGTYTVTRNGGNARTVGVSVGTASTVDFVAAGGDATTLDTVTVVGTGAINPIDVSSVESTTILTAEQINKIPVARDTTSVALLAPGTVRGDAAFGNLASFGGSSVAENQYYVNGFNVTNTFNNLNFGQVPFEAIAEQQIKTGGYGAEFGRSLGGVVNQITKRGTNEFHAGGNIFYTPESLTEEVKNTYYSNPLRPDLFGQLRQDNSADETWQARANLWASGALIKDRLFAYGLVSYSRTEADTWGSVVSGTNTSSQTKAPNWLLKLDWNISDNHLLEFTAFSDESEQEVDTFLNTAGQFDRLDFLGTTVNETGGDNFVVKYTGYLTDTFTLSALAGHSEFSRGTHLIGPDGRRVEYTGDFTVPTPGAVPTGGCPVILDSRGVSPPIVSQCNISGGQLTRSDSGDERDQLRLDAEWQLGDHLLRFGYDSDDYTSVAGAAFEGGYRWQYLTNNGPDGTPGTADDFEVARLQYTSQGTSVEVQQHAFYIEDSWHITDNFIAYFGGRWDTFENINGSGQTYLKISNQFGPRLGFSWDVNGDSTFKVFGNAGRYALPLTPSVAVRGASASIFTREDFRPANGANTFTIDPVTGAPTNAETLGNFRYINNEFGVAQAARSIASKTIDPMYQDEYILGFQKQLTDHFSMGVRGIYRDLKAAIDDNCDYAPIYQWALDNGFDLDPDHGGFQEPDPANPNEIAFYNPGFPFCRLYNPGADNIFEMDVNGDGTFETIPVPGNVLGPKAKRNYTALELFFDGNWDRFFLQGSYTFARSTGNTEGGVKSDIGQANTNVTQDFDYEVLTRNTYGYLPNDRRHSLKLFGSYDLTEEWTIGANLLVQSGRPINCFGVFDTDSRPPLTDANGNIVVDPTDVRAPFGVPDNPYHYRPHPYGSSFMQCSNRGDARFDDSVEIAPRGTRGRLPWTSQLDLNVAYQPNWAEGLQFKVDVFNVLNSQKVTSVSETAEVAATGAASPTYLLPLSFQAPRSVRFMVQYDF